MKLIIFAGGVGTRLWPLSRQNSPKQFDKFFNGKSTLELAIERLKNKFGIENIYIQTVDNFKSIIREQIPDLPKDNIFIEPLRRNLGPAVCLSVLKLKEKGISGPMAILWADHLIDRPDDFVDALVVGEELIKKEAKRFVFMSEKPRFANNNLGWVRTGASKGLENGREFFEFSGWKYKPDSKVCEKMFNSVDYGWNPGYFITSIDFLHDEYKALAPDTYEKVKNGKYKEAEAISFDRAIIEKVDLKNAVVIKTDMGWSDPGTLYALKDVLVDKQEDSAVHGNVSSLDTSDCLLYNSEEGKLIAAVGLKGMVVVNTSDALVIAPKEKVVKITELVKKLKEEGKHEYL